MNDMLTEPMKILSQMSNELNNTLVLIVILETFLLAAYIAILGCVAYAILIIAKSISKFIDAKTNVIKNIRHETPPANISSVGEAKTALAENEARYRPQKNL